MMTLKQLLSNEGFLLDTTRISITADDTVLADKISYDELQKRLKTDLAEYASQMIMTSDWYWDTDVLVYRLDIHISSPKL